MLNVLDEFTHESLAIRVARKLKAIDVIDVLSDLFIAARSAGAHSIRQRARVCRQGRAGMDRRRRCQDGLHRTRQPVGERLHRELQRPPARRAAGRGDLLFAEGGSDRDRELATPLQCRPPARPRLAIGRRLRSLRTSARRVAVCALGIRSDSHAPASVESWVKLTFESDHSTGADQSPWCKINKRIGRQIE